LEQDRLRRENQKKEILLHRIVHGLSQPFSALRRCRPDQTATSPPALEPSAAEKLPVPALPGSQVKPMRVLVADDSSAHCEFTRQLLERSGHSVVAVTNGQEALSALEQDSFDLVFLDAEMPQMDGIATAKAIRARERSSHAHIPIIAFTASAEPNDVERYRAVGMDGCLRKPFHLEDLYRALQTVGYAAAQPEPGEPAEQDSSSSFLAAVGGNAQLLRKLAGIFLTDSRKMMSEIVRAASRRNSSTMASTAHALKGAIGIFGAKRAAAAAQKLERMGRAGDLEDVAAAVLSLQVEMKALQQQLAPFASEARPKGSQSTGKTRKKAGRR
jgi:CheY-like chemotaxis protein/HPt (histidine-containing phosphotransfer) domain-containing protein